MLSMRAEMSQKIGFFTRRFFRLKRFEDQFNIKNKLIRPQMASQIAGIDILHMLGNVNTYMKKCSKPAINVIFIMTNLTSCLICKTVFFIIFMGVSGGEAPREKHCSLNQ